MVETWKRNDKKFFPRTWREKNETSGMGLTCAARFFSFAQHGHALTGESPQAALITGRLQPKTRVSVATRNLKEVGGKHLL